MDKNSLMFNNIHHSLRVIGAYYSYIDIAYDEKPTFQLEKELRDLKCYYLDSGVATIDSKALDKYMQNVSLKFKHSDNINEDDYAQQIVYLHNKLQHNQYANFEIIDDPDFKSVLNIVFGLENLKNEGLLNVLRLEKNKYLLKNIFSTLLIEVRYYMEYLYKQQMLKDHSNNINIDKIQLWFPIAKYSNMLINSDYKEITKDVFLNPDFLKVRERHIKLFLDGFGYMVNLNGTSKLPYLVYSSSCECKENSIINIGGLTVFSEDLDDKLLKDIYLNVDDIYLPPYFEKSILNNPNYIPSNYLYMVDTITSTVTKLEPSGDVPLNLLKPTITKLSSKYIFVKGGIQINRSLVSNYNEEKSSRMFLKQEVSYNQNSYLLNVETGHYSLIKEQDTSNSATPPVRVGHSQVLLKDRSLLHFETGYLNYLQKLNTLNNSDNSIMNNQKLSIQNFLDTSFDDESSAESSRQSSDTSVIFEDDEIVDEDDDGYKEHKKLLRWNLLLFGGYDYNLEKMHNKGIKPTNDMYLIRVYLTKDVKTNSNIVKIESTPTMLVKKIILEEKLTGPMPDPTAFHSSTLIPPGILNQEQHNVFKEAGERFDSLIETFDADPKKFNRYVQACKEQDVKSNRTLLNDIKLNILENRKKSTDSKDAAYTLMIHGGYGDRIGFHDKFLFFNFKKFQWEEKTLKAPLSLELNVKPQEIGLKKHKSKLVDIHLRLSNHHFFLKGKYIICVGGKLDITQKKDYIRIISKKIPVTVIHLPTMEIKDVAGIIPEQESMRPKSYMIGYDGDVIQCPNGELYICNGICHTLYDKEQIKTHKQILLSDANLKESDYFYDQIGILGVNMVYIPPTFTNL